MESDAAFEILYRDRHLLVVDKAPGIAVQSASLREKDLTDRIRREILAPGDGAGGYLGIVHRLDQPVRGLVVFALDKKSAANLSEQTGGEKMRKVYLALVKTENPSMLPEFGEIRTLENDLLKDARTNRSFPVPKGTRGAKHAALQYRRVSLEEAEAEKLNEDWIPGPGEALLEIRLQTGRHHQIRVQMAAAGLPVKGDRKYGQTRTQEQLPYPMLCALKLEFTHPATGKRMCFTSRQVLAKNPVLSFNNGQENSHAVKKGS